MNPNYCLYEHVYSTGQTLYRSLFTYSNKLKKTELHYVTHNLGHCEEPSVLDYSYDTNGNPILLAAKKQTGEPQYIVKKHYSPQNIITYERTFSHYLPQRHCFDPNIYRQTRYDYSNGLLVRESIDEMPNKPNFDILYYSYDSRRRIIQLKHIVEQRPGSIVEYRYFDTSTNIALKKEIYPDIHETNTTLFFYQNGRIIKEYFYVTNIAECVNTTNYHDIRTLPLPYTSYYYSYYPNGRLKRKTMKQSGHTRIWIHQWHRQGDEIVHTELRKIPREKPFLANKWFYRKCNDRIQQTN